MLKSTEAYSTVELRENQRETYARGEIMEIARPLAQWIASLSDAAESDRDAILKRLIFVDVTEPLVPAALAAAWQRHRGADLKEAFKSVGLCAPTDGTLGGWVDA